MGSFSIWYWLLTCLAIYLIVRVLRSVFGASVEQRPAESTAASSRRRAASSSGIDAPEPSLWEAPALRMLPSPREVQLDYADAAGNETRRVVRVWRFGALGEHLYARGFCMLRGEWRTFRCDRISQCVDMSTGEMIDLGNYLGAQGAAREQLLDDEYDAVRVLFYVGKADGQLRAPERELIVEACRALAPGNENVDRRAVDDMLLSLEIPTEAAFKMAVRRLVLRDEPVRTIVMTACERIVATQKKVHPMEQAALDFMRVRLGMPGRGA